jgi:hypothetical protein
MVIIIIYNFYVTSFYLKFTLFFKQFTFGVKIELFLKYSFCQSMIDKIVHRQNKTFTYQLERNVLYRSADWSQDRRYQALSSWGSGEQGGVGQWVKREGQIGSVYN